MTNACDSFRKAHKKCLFVVRPFQPCGQRSSHPRFPRKDSFVVNNDETMSQRKWSPGPQAGQQERFRTISPVPSKPSDYPANEGWRWQEDIQAWAHRHHVLSPMGLKCQKQNPPNPPRQDSPVPSLACEKTPQQPTPGPKPPIPGLSPSSQPPEDVTTREPEPEVAPTQSTEEPFGKSQFHFFNSTQLFLTPPSTISSLSRHSPLHNHHRRYARWIPPSPEIPSSAPENPNASSPPVQSPSHSHNDACQEFTDLRPTLMIPRAIVHESINRILLEHRCLLHIIPCVDATHRNEMHQEFWEELNSLLAQVLEAYPKEDITGIVSKYLEKLKKTIIISSFYYL
ncbi:hypothetical protein O181_092381 [Austropuccinia psidii MF-1]|uniref:Uncharacterized protein n=1 Tax=Austropuccinia psidii MF-1 TaxID=1389203 RepID=A0A9Q3PAJ7_9BASI|nr:hypothetical protein [Austropuccinia psidii MF-1]